MTAGLWLLQPTDPAAELGAINSGVVEYIKLVLVLGVILALAFVVLRLGLPRLAAAHNLAPGVIQVAARYALEPKKSLYVIRVGEDYCLLGTTESGMHDLAALPPGDIESALAQTAPPPQDRFAALTRSLRRRKGSS